jgi:hypothetical protein
MDVYDKTVIPSNKERIRLSLDVYDANYGKIHTLKHIVSKDRIDDNDYDFFMYADHDIIFTDSSTMYLHMFLRGTQNPLNIQLNKRTIKMVSFSQLIDSRHNPIILTHVKKIKNNIYHYSANNVHVATGCFLTDCCIIKLFTSLKTDLVYGEEDILIGNMLNKYKMVHLVTSNYHIEHPIETDIEYMKWKEACIFTALIKIMNDKSNNNK